MRRAPVIAALALWAGAASAAPLPRVASTTICGDQLVLGLADRSQIASVSNEATGPLSLHAARAHGLPSNRKAAEELLATDADVVLMDANGEPKLSDMLQRLGIRVIRLPLSAEIEAIEATMLEVAEAIGQPARGEQMAANMRRRMAAVEAARPAGPWPRLAYYRPDGGSAGHGTFVDTAMQAAGFANVQADRGQDGWGSLPLEVLVQHPPDGLVISFFDTAKNSVKRAFMNNSYLRNVMRHKPVIGVPGKLWPCAGPMIVDAAELLARARPAFPTSGAMQ